MTPLVLALVLALLPAPVSSARDAVIWVFDDFEDGDCAATPGECWVAISDALMGGSSKTRMSWSKPGAAGSKGAFRVEGHVAEKGFAGAWTAIAPGGRAGDVSGFAGVRLLARGRGSVSVGIRGGPGTGTNFTAPILLRSEWGLIEVPFAALAATPGQQGEAKFDPANVRWLGVTSGSPGPFAIEIDEIALYHADGSSASPPATLSGPAQTVREPYTDPALLTGARWRELTRDPAGDGRSKTLPDALALSQWRDEKNGLVWIRVALAAPPPPEGIGVNVALDIDGDAQNGMAWWGTNTAFHFDRLVTAFLFDTGSQWQGTIGIADAATVQAGDMMTGAFGLPRVILDRAGHTVSVGFPRAALGPGKAAVRAVVATGSPMVFNDDVPAEGTVRIAR
jgi:hypothetical protein